MQANTIVTATDSPTGTVKTGKNSSSANLDISFNQMLDKEIYNSKKPELDMARPASRPVPPAKSNNTSNNVNATNIKTAGNNGNDNNLDTKENTTTPVSSQTVSKSDKPESDSGKLEQDDGTTEKDDDIGTQILALVGNLAAPPITTDVKAAAAPAPVDTAKTDSLAAIGANTAKNLTDPADATLASLNKSGPDTLDKTDLQSGNQLKAISVQQRATDETDVSRIAAQIMASQPAGKTSEKVVTGNASPADAAILTGKTKSAEANGDISLTPVVADSEASATTPFIRQTTSTADKSTATKASEAKTNDIDLGNKLADKPVDSHATATNIDTAKSFSRDIAQAKDALSEHAVEVKVNPANKDLPQVVAAPPTVQVVNASQFNAANALAAEQISTRVGSAGWDKAVGQKVVWMVGEGLQSAELTLNPPDLGPLQVVLKVSNDQASANFSSAQPEVREALEAALPRLKQMLSDAGVQLSGFSVNSQSAGQGQSFADQQARSTSGSNTRISNETIDSPVNTASTTTAKAISNNGLVDTFV